LHATAAAAAAAASNNYRCVAEAEKELLLE
jgi:hypothetical protein